MTNEADKWCSETRVVKDEGCECQGCESEKTTQAMGPWTDVGYSGIAYSDMCPECRCAPGTAHAGDCPECVPSDTNLGPWPAGRGYFNWPESNPAPDAAPSTTDVSFPVQEWCFEQLVTAKLDELHDLIVIDDYRETIIEMARDRFRKGYAKYGSTMYGWSAQERLRNALEELSDAVVYLTSGPVT